MTMKNSLHDRLNALAAAFAGELLDALRGASLEELADERPIGLPRGGARARSSRVIEPSSKPARGRLARRSPEQLERELALVVRAVKDAEKTGMRAEQIRAALGIDRRELPRVLKLGLATKRLRAKGAKRSTTYFPH